MKFSMVFKDL